MARNVRKNIACISSRSSLTNSAISCRHSGEFTSREARVRPMPSASAMVSYGRAGGECFRDPGQAAFSAKLGGCWLRLAGSTSMFSALGFLTHANRHENFAYVSGSTKILLRASPSTCLVKEPIGRESVHFCHSARRKARKRTRRNITARLCVLAARIGKRARPAETKKGCRALRSAAK
jgi:hypothetical protein